MTTTTTIFLGCDSVEINLVISYSLIDKYRGKIFLLVSIEIETDIKEINLLIYFGHI